MLAAIVRAFSVWARLGAPCRAVGPGCHVEVRRVDRPLIGSPYGRLVLIKIAIASVIAAAGWWNWRVVTPSLEGLDESAPEWLRLAIWVELSLATIVLAVTAVLVGSWLPIHGWR